MPGIKISNSLKSKLPEGERDGIEDFLWNKSGGICHLCGDPLNRASEEIEADHDEPEGEAGETNRANLHLAHRHCNRIKKNNPSIDVRPYLRLNEFAKKKQNVVRYDDVQEHFGIVPAPVVLEKIDTSVRFELPDGSIVHTPLLIDPAHGRPSYEYVFLSVPRDAIFNDDECQPRTIKLSQVWSIFRDLQGNPLHEPPSCRTIPSDVSDTYHLVMFDGQHKTIANWMHQRQAITVKVYLNLSAPETIHLVNSIQAKIKKLPLSSFELSAKMSDEWANEFAKYEEETNGAQASEVGFISWLPPADRTRGKQAFHAALIQEFLDSPDVAMLKYVNKAGTPPEQALMTETTFSKKVLERLVTTTPLTQMGDEGQILRLREKANITTVLNLVTEAFFEPNNGEGEPSEQQLTRTRRFAYQSSLAYVAGLLKSLYRQVLAVEPERAMMEKVPNEEQLTEIRQAVVLLADHPVWTADLESSEKMKAVGDALSKNQDAKGAFEAVDLKVGYLIGADTLPADCVS